MTVLLVLFTFLLFLLIDYIRSRGKIAVITPQFKPLRALFNGFFMPENLFFHPGHTWALAESPTLVRVGIDDFTAKLLGSVDDIQLPNRNTWIRQGQKFATVTRDGNAVSLISPIEGTVTDVNYARLKPGTIQDPYGEDWLMTVSSPDQKTSLRNLLHNGAWKWFIGDAVNRLHPALAQDGGEVVEDFAVKMGLDWVSTAKEFLLN
jgi:glycine cleavage system H lipoate-binding protein